MKIIRPKAFAFYASMGLVMASITTGGFGLRLWNRPNPAYPAYEKLQDDYAAEAKRIEPARAARAEMERIRPFQEVLLGEKPAAEIKNDNVRELATLLRTAASLEPEAKGAQLAEVIQKLPLLMHGDCSKAKIYWDNARAVEVPISHWGVCSTSEFELVRTEPEHIARLLNGDKTALSPLPEVPALDTRLAAFLQMTPEPKTFPIKWTRIHYLQLWLAFSGAFALTYFVVGLISGRTAEDHPVRAVPGFILGWLILLATLPGFLLVYAIWLICLILTGDFASVIKKMDSRRADAHKLKLGKRILAALKTCLEVQGYRDLTVLETLKHDNLRRALDSRVLPATMKDEVEEFIELDATPPAADDTPSASTSTR